MTQTPVPGKRDRRFKPEGLQAYFDDLLLEATVESPAQQAPQILTERKEACVEKRIKAQAPNAASEQAVQHSTYKKPEATPQPHLSTVAEQLKEMRPAEPGHEQSLVEDFRKKKLQSLLDQNVALGEIPLEKLRNLIPEVSEVPQEALPLKKKSVNEELEWHENGRPLWAQNRFDALLFDVSGLTLAVPLIALGQIQNLGEELTPIFGQSGWFMGLLPTPLGQIKTLNTALFVMPERYQEGFVKTAKYVLSIDGLSWGLAVDSVNQPITLDPDEVKWRSDRSKRPWLAGTVKSAMCALIDIPQMGKLLRESEN